MNSRIALVVVLSALLTACGPSREDVTSFVRTSLHNEFRDNPKYARYALEVQDLALVQSGDHEFKGIAKVTMDGQAHDVDVEAIVDGTKIMWRTGPLALSFLAEKQFEEAVKPLRHNSADHQDKAAASGVPTSLSPCVQARIDAFRKERGEEVLVRPDMLDEWEGQCSSQASE